MANGLQRPADALEAQLGRLSPSRPKNPWPCGGMIVEGLARLLPQRWRVFFPFGARRRDCAIGKTSKIFTASSMDSHPPSPTFAMSAEVAPFRFFPVTALKKSARPARQVDRLCRDRAPARFEKLSRAPSSRFASEKRAARPGRAQLRQDPDEGSGRGGQPAWLPAFRAGSFRERREGQVC